MKILSIILILSTCISCAEISTDNKVDVVETKFLVAQSENKLSQQNDKLIGTWYVKELLINGKPDLEDYPVNNDELTLNQDNTMTTIDRTFDMEDRGTWERISDSQFAIEIEHERVMFQIIKLTDTELETKMLTNEIDLVTKYKKEK